MLVALILFVLLHSVFVLPGIRPSNSYGMMLDGFLVKDFLDKKYIVYLLLCIPIELVTGQAHIFLGLAIFSFVFFAYVGGWLQYYCYSLLAVPAVLTLLLTLTSSYVGVGLLVAALVILLILSRYFAREVFIHARYKRWIQSSLTSYLKRFGKILPSTEPHHSITLSLMFIEDRSRPKLTRWVEYAKGSIQGTVHSYGIMQVQSRTRLNDTQSVAAANKLIGTYLKGKKMPLTKNELQKLAKQWNGSIDYTDLLDYVYSVTLKIKK